MLSDIKTAAFEVNDRLKKLIQSVDDEDTTTDGEDKTRTSATEQRPQKTTPTQPSTSQAMMAKLTPQMSPKHSPRSNATQADTKTSPPSSQTSPPSSTTEGASPKQDSASPKEPSEQTSSESPPPTNKEVAAAPRFHLLPVLGTLINYMKNPHHETRMETLRWIMWLQQRIPKRVRSLIMYTVTALTDSHVQLYA